LHGRSLPLQGRSRGNQQAEPHRQPEASASVDWNRERNSLSRIGPAAGTLAPRVTRKQRNQVDEFLPSYSPGRVAGPSKGDTKDTHRQRERKAFDINSSSDFKGPWPTAPEAACAMVNFMGPGDEGRPFRSEISRRARTLLARENIPVVLNEAILNRGARRQGKSGLRRGAFLSTDGELRATDGSIRNCGVGHILPSCH